jgi:hypothetical protein
MLSLNRANNKFRNVFAVRFVNEERHLLAASLDLREMRSCLRDEACVRGRQPPLRRKKLAPSLAWFAWDVKLPARWSMGEVWIGDKSFAKGESATKDAKGESPIFLFSSQPRVICVRCVAVCAILNGLPETQLRPFSLG